MSTHKFLPDDPAFALDYNTVVRVVVVEFESPDPSLCRYSVMRKGGETTSNYPGYLLRPPTQVQLDALFGPGVVKAACK